MPRPCGVQEAALGAGHVRDTGDEVHEVDTGAPPACGATALTERLHHRVRPRPVVADEVVPAEVDVEPEFVGFVRLLHPIRERAPAGLAQPAQGDGVDVMTLRPGLLVDDHGWGAKPRASRSLESALEVAVHGRIPSPSHRAGDCTQSSRVVGRSAYSGGRYVVNAEDHGLDR